MAGRPATGGAAGGVGAAPYVFLAPLALFALVFFVVPLGFSVWLSFTRWNPLGSPQWVGWRQFEYLLTRDDAFWRSVANTFVFAGGFVLVGVPLALGLAFAFSRARGRTVWRSVYYLPQLTNVVAIAYLWQFVLDDRYGLVNRLLGMAGLRGPDWLTDPVMAMISVVMVMIWYDAGKNMLVFSAALEAVDQDVYDAATLDGAGAWRTLRSVTLPIIRPAFVFVTITSFITGMGFFALILAMTGGGPRGATDVTALYAYRMAFEDLRMGRASAAALILFALIGVVAAVQFRVLQGRKA